MEIEILYEDNHLLVVNKPPGMLTQADSSGELSIFESIQQFIKKRDNKPGNVFLGMVQRLDKPVSGVIFFAKTSKAAARLSKEIREHRAQKIYLAVTERPTSLVLTDSWNTHQVQLKRVGAKTLIVDNKSGGQKAILQTKVILLTSNHGVQLIKLVTGRKHQIRAQMAHLGCGILGDQKYGVKTAPPRQGTIGLHALYGAMKHPVKNEIVVCQAPIPGYMQNYLDAPEYSQLEKVIEQTLDNLESI